LHTPPTSVGVQAFVAHSAIPLSMGKAHPQVLPLSKGDYKGILEGARDLRSPDTPRTGVAVPVPPYSAPHDEL